MWQAGSSPPYLPFQKANSIYGKFMQIQLRERDENEKTIGGFAIEFIHVCGWL